MRKYILLLIALSAITNIYARDRVSFTISKPLCLLTFIEATNGTGQIAPSLVNYIQNHVSKDDAATFNHFVTEFSKLELNYSYTFPAYPLQRQHPKTVINMITIAAVQTKTVDEFLNRIVGILPNEQWMKLKNIMAEAEPIYDKMIFQPYGEDIQHQLAELSKLSGSTDSIFNKIKQFYGSTWGDDMPFTISIYPVPGKRGATTATPHSNSLVLAVQTEGKDYAMRTGIAIHEICHVLYEEQPLALQQTIDSLFKASNSPFKEYAYSYIDEALATACGNGWAYKILSGHMDKTEWYNDEYINGYAHAIYIPVAEYIAQGKTIDKDFIEKAITLFSQKFPDAIYDRQIQLNRVNLYTDADNNDQYGQINNVIRKYYNISSCSGSYPIADPQGLDMVSSSAGTQFFIIHANHSKNYEALRTKFPQMKSMQADKEGIINFFDEKRRPVIIVNVRDMSRLDKGIAKLAASKKMDPAQPFTSLE